ncbi:MAG: hypothetical protein ACREGG_02605 [Candidatus Saccharimonadales bacterium]
MTKLTSSSPPTSPAPTSSSSLSLQQLAELEQIYNGGSVNRVMKFTDIPDSTKGAQSQAVSMASTLDQFASKGISPLVVMEPVSDSSGNPVDFQAYRNGAYDSILSTYFQTLKGHGISDAMMGMWVYFPEANLPEWGPVDQSDFAPNVVRTAQLQKQYFPNSLSSIMLDAESYPAGSTSWSSGSYVSLAPFINGIPSGLIDSFGLQGFPWVPAANVSGQASSLNPAVYLNSSLAAAAAKQLGVSQIWLNTGTFAASYTNNPSQTVNMTAAQRQAILNGVLQQATDLKSAGFGVAVNLFSEDKSNTSEATDLSYQTSDAQAVLKNFASQLQSAGIGFWLFSG